MNCPSCKKYFDKKQKCLDHINRFHANELDSMNMDASQWLYASTHDGHIYGLCMCGCGRKTEWNYKTGKPYKISTNPDCRKRLYDKAEENMQKARGTTVHSLLHDMEHQKEMQKHRPTYGTYKFPDGGSVDYLSSLELNFLKFCDKVLDFTSNMFAPCPETFSYFDDKESVWRQYMPDYYLPDYNLIIEIKDGGKKHNTNPKYVEETGYKVAIKDAAMRAQTKYNFIRISGANYGPFIETLYQIVHVQEPNKNLGKTSKNLVVITETACKVDEQKDSASNIIPEDLGLKNDYYLMIKYDEFDQVMLVAITRKTYWDTWFVSDHIAEQLSMRTCSDPILHGYVRTFRFLPNNEIKQNIANAYQEISSNNPSSWSILEILASYNVWFSDGKYVSNNFQKKMHFAEVDFNQIIEEACNYVSALFPV